MFMKLTPPGGSALIALLVNVPRLYLLSEDGRLVKVQHIKSEAGEFTLVK